MMKKGNEQLGPTFFKKLLTEDCQLYLCPRGSWNSTAGIGFRVSRPVVLSLPEVWVLLTHMHKNSVDYLKAICEPLKIRKA